MREDSGELKAMCDAACACASCAPAMPKATLMAHGANCSCCSVPQSQVSLNGMSLAQLVNSLVGKERA